MTLQTLKLGKEEFVVLSRRDFDRLAADAARQREDDYWTQAALEAEAAARANNERPIALAEVERQLQSRNQPRRTPRRRK